MNTSIKFKISIFVVLTMVALVFYFSVTQLSNPVEQDLMSDFKASQTAAPASSNQDSAASLAPVDELLVGLKQRLERQPDDVGGWVLLSKSYFHMNRWKEADEAFEKAKSLGYTGSWQPLPRIDAFSQDSSSSQKFDSSINFRDYKINEDLDQTKSQVGEAVNQTGSNVPADLKLKVLLNPALQKQLPPESPVFVFVRAAGSPGPPLAVVRKTVSELPFELVLNDSHAMIPGRTISSAKNIIVGARISMSGNAQRQPGDYEKLSNSIPANYSNTVELVINDKI